MRATSCTGRTWTSRPGCWRPAAAWTWRATPSPSTTRAVPTQSRSPQDSGQEGSEDRSKSDIYYYYNVRNRLLYAGLRLDRATQRRWVATAGRAAREIVLRGGKRQLLRTRRPLVTAAQATRDGLRLLQAARRDELPDVDEPLIRS